MGAFEGPENSLHHERMRAFVARIAATCSGLAEVRLMEVCGTHTVALFRSGIRSVLPQQLRLLSGPGCPVCVTPQGYIDAALDAARRPNVTICTYGDMLRVPGRSGTLEDLRAEGADVKVCYSIRDSLRYARDNPGREVVFLSVGFETTIPAAALAVVEAARSGLANFMLLCGHKRIMPALIALVQNGDTAVDGFLLPGHVSVILGSGVYAPLVEQYGKACAVAGFEPGQLLDGILHLVAQIAGRSPKLENVYGLAVTAEGNPHARRVMEEVFDPADTEWRAMGTIPGSGLELNARYERFDALRRLDLSIGPDYEPPGCRCGEVIQGRADPPDCRHFGGACTPDEPVGPCMVSSEGTCAAWYRYARRAKE